MSSATPASIATPDRESGTWSGLRARRKHAPVLITEKQLAFSTAAALSALSLCRWWLYTALIAQLGRSPAALTQPRPHHPRHEPAYFEAARWPGTGSDEMRRGCRGRWNDCDGADAVRV